MAEGEARDTTDPTERTKAELKDAIAALKELMETKVVAQRELSAQRWVDMEKAISKSEAAIEKAITKAEEATNKRFEAINTDLRRIEARISEISAVTGG